MMNIKILGTGCPNCKRTEAAVKVAVDDLKIEAQIEKVEDIMEIMKYNIMSTPAVVIDDVVKIKGRVPSVQELKDLLSTYKPENCCEDGTDCCKDINEKCCDEFDPNCCSEIKKTNVEKDSCCGGTNCC